MTDYNDYSNHYIGYNHYHDYNDYIDYITKSHHDSKFFVIMSNNNSHFIRENDMANLSSDGSGSSRHRKFVPSTKCTRCPSPGEIPSNLQCTREKTGMVGICKLFPSNFFFFFFNIYLSFSIFFSVNFSIE